MTDITNDSKEGFVGWEDTSASSESVALLPIREAQDRRFDTHLKEAL